MSTLREVEVFPIRVPVTAALRFASGSTGAPGDGAVLVLVRIADSDGCRGWGECRPLPQWSYETPESVVTTLRHYLAPAVLGLETSDRCGLQRRMQAVIGRGPSTGQPIAKAALDLALADLAARRAGLPLRCFLGGSRERSEVALSFTVTAHDAAGARDQVRVASAEGFLHFNIKVGVAPETDLEVAAAVREAAGPRAFVWADANQGCSLPAAIALCRGLAEVPVDLFEQPFPADQPHLLRRLRPHCAVPLAVDEASVSPADFQAHVTDGLVDYLVVKLTRSGGVWPTLQQLAVAEAAGLPFVTSGLTDGLLTKLAACQVTAAYGGTGPAALNGSQFIDEAALYPGKGMIEAGGRVRLPDQPGIGVEPEEEAMRRAVVPELAT
ncbi:MAG: enolase C-terminal domain-like protein [Candidatus Dormiibacterota bacterium]